MQVMNISVEKAEIIRRLQGLEDEAVIMAIRLLLDAQDEQNEVESGLDYSINRALSQSQAGEVRPHKSVMAEIRNRHKG